jgi:hypothetical protein
LLFAASISLIRARPYNDNDFRFFFLPPENCRRPCWQQIRPGATTVNEALNILEGVPWAADVVVNKQMISWTWGDESPLPVDTRLPGKMLISNNYIVAIAVPLNISFGDLQVLFGQPRWRSLGKFNRNVSVQFTYPQEYVTMSMRLECPMNLASFWYAQPEILLNSTSSTGQPYTSSLEFLKNC